MPSSNLRSGLVAAGGLVLCSIVVGCGGGASVPAPVQSIAVEELTKDPVVVRPDYHVVQPGETLIEIALTYGLDYKDIALWSAVSNPDLIEVGQRLELKAPENAPVVKRVETQKIEPVAAVQAEPAALTRKIVPETKVIGGDAQMVDEIPPAEAVAVKSGPIAVSHPYSQEKLDELRNQAEPGIADPDELAYAPEVPAPPTNAPVSKREKFGNDWSWPVSGTPKVLDSFSAESRGINIGGEPGSPVFASAEGEILYAGSGMKGYGNLIVIRHSNDYVSAYGNNQELLVGAQDKVTRGQVIAKMGKSGASRVQLHFEIRKGGKPLDPLQFVPPSP